MNVLFLSIVPFYSINSLGIYPDLLRVFTKNGHTVYILSPSETPLDISSEKITEDYSVIFRVFTGKIQKTSSVRKGINTVLLEHRFIAAVKKHLSDVTFDLVLYPTPPITLVGAVRYVKRRDQAKTYLMLKDIFPQNAVDMGILSRSGLKGIIYRYFRCKEKKLYAISDHIGCMSPANAEYLLKYNSEISPEKVEICPNSIEIRDLSLTDEMKVSMREKYGLPIDKKIFVYGGNLGMPQGIPFIIECLKTQINNPDAYFLIAGSGTESGKLKDYFEETAPKNMRLMKWISQEDYDRMIAACDVGMIFLDHRFTIPNFPSRLLSYMQAKIPTLAVTDTASDIGNIIKEGKFGWWCESNDSGAFVRKVREAMRSNLTELGENGFVYLKSHYEVEDSVNLILSHIK